MACSRIKKADCQKPCEWIVGKGCKKETLEKALKKASKEAPDKAPKKASKEVPEKALKKVPKEAPEKVPKKAPKKALKKVPKEAPDKTQKKTSNSLVSQDDRKKVFAMIHPKLQFTALFNKAIDEILLSFCRYTAQGHGKLITKQDIIESLKDERIKYIGKQLIAVGQSATLESTMFADITIIRTHFGKDLDNDAGKFLSGCIKFLFEDITELAGNIASVEGKKRVNAKHVDEVVQDSLELQVFV
jgi:histone H3/H4